MADPNDSTDGTPEEPAPKSNVMKLPQSLKDKMHSQSIPSTGPEQMPRFDIHTLTRADVATEIRGLIANKPEPTVYRFADQPVQIVEAEVEAFLDEAKKVRATTARPVPLNEHSATGHIEDVVRFYKQNADGPVDKPIPDWIRSLLIKTGVEEFPTLKGILRHPVIMDGKMVHGDKGYDRDSQFLIKAHMPSKVRPEVMTDTPKQLLDWLLEEWLGETSFDTTEDAIRALMIPASMLVTKTHLMAEGKFPAFLISAPDAGTGKSELAHALVEVVAGEDIGDTPWPEKDGPEMQKLVTSLILADVDVILWDNLPNGMTLKNTSLDLMLTSLVWTARILGASQIINAPSNAMNVLTGNNVQPFADTSTRIVEVRLVLKNGKPPTYNRISLRQWTKENRASIVTALARIMIETPKIKMEQVGRYPGWFNRVALPFISLTGTTQIFDTWKTAPPTWDAAYLAKFLKALRETSASLYPAFGGDRAMSAQDLLMTIPDETADFFGVDEELMEQVNRKLSPSMTDTEREDAKKAQKRALTKAAQSISMRFAKQADRSADGLRLRVGKVKNDVYREQPAVWAEIIESDENPG